MIIQSDLLFNLKYLKYLKIIFKYAFIYYFLKLVFDIQFLGQTIFVAI